MDERPSGRPQPGPAFPLSGRTPSSTRQVRPLTRLIALAVFAVALPTSAFAFWWLPSYTVEDSLPGSASSTARTTAALCDRGAEGWCYGLAFMYACGDEGLQIDMARAAELEQLECVVDPSHCQASATMLGEWDAVGTDMQAFSCRVNRMDITQGLQALPDFMERAGVTVAPPAFAAGLE
jgi:hypothetical protein